MNKNSCLIDNCGAKTRARGLCSKHYSRLIRHGDPNYSTGRFYSKTGICSVDKCDKKHKARGFCNYHYEKALAAGTVGHAKNICRVDGCNSFVHCNFLCDSHYKITIRFKITIEEYLQMLNEQNEVCAICNEPCALGRRLAVDHDHKTGRVRGLLCSRCNTSIGKFNDDVSLLKSAIKYLERNC